ncbi:hypothetical protein GCM10009830_40820 [Glycomyces endophyticus]|uniref:PE domain-containing protein n=1 Tax=Glycomyces endophyticus TaxID=480996 RepID=A0ABN2HJL3_9ACTN
MPDSPGEGGQFAADLYELYEVAQKDLLPLAETYSSLSAQVGRSSDFDLDPPPVAETVARGQSALRSGSGLQAIRDDVQYAFARSSQNVESAARTLIEVTENYADTDDATRSDFDSLVTDGFPSGVPTAGPHDPVYPSGTGGRGPVAHD